jgi:hypothetical protein
LQIISEVPSLIPHLGTKHGNHPQYSVRVCETLPFLATLIWPPSHLLLANLRDFISVLVVIHSRSDHVIASTPPVTREKRNWKKLLRVSLYVSQLLTRILFICVRRWQRLGEVGQRVDLNIISLLLHQYRSTSLLRADHAKLLGQKSRNRLATEFDPVDNFATVQQQPMRSNQPTKKLTLFLV